MEMRAASMKISWEEEEMSRETEENSWEVLEI